MVNFSLDFRARAVYTKRMENEEDWDNDGTEYEKGQALVTEELLQAARNLLSAAVPDDASNDMIAGFWQAVYDYI